MPVKRDKTQVSLETITEQEIADRLKKVNLNEYTPVDALFLLRELISMANA
jgi:hypothetical protein